MFGGCSWISFKNQFKIHTFNINGIALGNSLVGTLVLWRKTMVERTWKKVEVMGDSKAKHFIVQRISMAVQTACVVAYESAGECLQIFIFIFKYIHTSLAIFKTY